MLEGLAAWVLNTYIGEYLENLNTDQLSVALLQGQVELENVPLKKTALKKLDVPLAVKSGVLGKLTLRVPLTHLRSEPWQVQMSDLYILLESSEHKYDIELDEQSQQNKKQQQLEALEAFHKKQLLKAWSLEPPVDAQSPTTSGGAGWFTYGASLVALIVENIQLTLTNVHIRFEDQTTLGEENSFVSGIKIQRVCVQTTDRFWEPRFVQRNDTENLFKSLELEGLSIYWNSGAKVSHPVATVRELTSLLAPDERSERENAYILSPVSAKVRMERNSSRFPLKTKPPIPRFKFELEPENVGLEVTKRQLAELKLMMREWARYDRARSYRKWRPQRQVKGNVPQWWNFACQCQLERIRKTNESRTWQYALNRAKLINSYARSYQRRLKHILENAAKTKTAAQSDPSSSEAQPSPSKDEASDTILMKQIERDPQYSYEDLHIVRDAVFRKLLGEGGEKTQQPVPGDDQFVSLTSLTSSGAYETPPEGSVTSSSSFQRIDEQGSDAGGLYSWLTSWFTAPPETQNSELDRPRSRTETSSSSPMSPGFLELHELPPHLREVEKHLEEEILDVLNESWDDSTVLRRDTLLAKISLKLSCMTLRLVDESRSARNDVLTTKLLAAELSNVFGEVRLSPRHHTLGVSLTVGDLSIHSEEFDSSAADHSMFWSPSLVNMFALGKSASSKSEDSPPLLRCVYERRAPALVARHLMDAQLAPISIMYHQDAMQLLAQFFDTSLPLNSELFNILPLIQEESVVSDLRTQLSFSFRVPHVSVELRSAALLPGDEQQMQTTAIGRAFACAHFENVICKLNKTDEFVTEVQMQLDSMKVEDLLEGEQSIMMKYLLRTTGNAAASSFSLSNSCPDLTLYEEPQEFVPFSLPTEQSHFDRPHTPVIVVSEERTAKVIHRKNSLHALSRDQGTCSIDVTLIQANHPKFESKYKKVGCIVRTRFADVELGMNRQTWTLLLDFLGLIGKVPANESDAVTDDRNTVHFDAENLVLDMNRPYDRTQLGRMSLSKVSALIQADNIGLKLSATSKTLLLEDLTPHYSDLYPQRIWAVNDPNSEATLELCFFSSPDPSLLRPCDMSVSVCLVAPGASYIHTHRYFIDFLNFWLNFFQLQDVLTTIKHAVAGRQISEFPGHGLRVLLKVDVQGPLSLVLPVHSLCDQVIVAEMEALRINNNFLLASQKVQHGAGNSSRTPSECYDSHDCLLDVMQLQCVHTSLHAGVRYSSDVTLPEKMSKAASFNGYFLARQTDNVLDQKLDLAVVLERNLDAAISKSVPDLSIYTQLSSLKCSLTLDLYKVFRGFLDHNLGDQLSPDNPTPEFWPQNASVAGAHCTVGLSFQLEMSAVYLYCLWPVASTWRPIALVELNDAKLSFESFSDQTTELDLICQNVALVDTRFRDVAANKRPNSYDRIFSARSLVESQKKKHLLAEIHFLTGKETPKLTILLADIRLICLLDWLTTAKDFLLASGEYFPPVTKKKSSTAKVETPRPGVVTRTLGLNYLPEQALAIKLNLRDCDLIFLEDAASRNSLALVLKTTSVLHVDNDISGALSVRLDAQAVQLSSCTMAVIQQSLCQLTNQFAASIELAPQHKHSLLSNVLKSSHVGTGAGGLLAVETVMHRVDISLSELIARLSYRDWLVFTAVLTGYGIHWDKYWNSEDENTHGNSKTQEPAEHENAVLIHKLRLKAESLGLWLLDDFQDTRFPLIRICCSSLDIEHNLCNEPADGCGSLELNCDYFNQRIYSWEPLIDPWTLELMSWGYMSAKNKLQLQIQSNKSVFDLNLTQVFLQQMFQFLGRWTEVKQALDNDFRAVCSGSRHDHLPYVLQNDTGVRLWFTTDVSALRSNQRSARWMEAQPGHSQTFEFPSRNLLNKDDDSPHQLVMKVDGWHEISAVTVDSVGTYFRLARCSSNSAASVLSTSANSARVVVVVNMDKDGRKVVTIRSALILVNALPEPLDVRLENLSTFIGDHIDISIPSCSWRAAPLHYALCKLSARPKGRWSVEQCSSFTWQHVRFKGQSASYARHCPEVNTTGNKSLAYRMCVNIKREHYPEEESGPQDTLPGHTITFMAPLSVMNLLPVEMSFSLPEARFQQCIAPGKLLSLSVVDVSSQVWFNLSTDTFRTNQPLMIPEGLSEEKLVALELIDGSNRPLILHCLLTPVRSGAIKMSISAPFWLVNNSALPLVVRQEAVDQLAAGQFDEHEQARNKIPLMFSFADNDCPRTCAVRVGRQHNHNRSLRPEWCRKFPLKPGITARKLVMVGLGDTPNIEYSIGIEVKQGQGLYKNTTVVLLTARFQLDNRSRYTLTVAQKHDTDNPAHHSTVHPRCNFVWHWSKTDAEPLLCIKRHDLPHWSAGFRIDKLCSFHLNIRDKSNRPQFLRVEITAIGSIYYMTITDADTFPAPIRIENHSDVPLLYRQVGCEENHLHAVLQPQSNVDYSYDDPHGSQHVKLTVFGNKSVEYNLVELMTGQPPLIYENFFFIRLVASFDRSGQSKDEQELVLEALQGGKIILNRMDGHRHSQLWRMSSSGCLENVEHCQKDPNSTTPIVLDVIKLDPSDFTEPQPLFLRKQDPKRRRTQKWTFTRDGRLECEIASLYVQTQNRHLRSSTMVMLGPTQPVSSLLRGVPIEQCFEKRHQKPGSGQLSVEILHQGPTRVLRVFDKNRRQLTAGVKENKAQMDTERMDLELVVHLVDGLGFSLVNAVNEELVYCRLTGILLRCERGQGKHMARMEVMGIQADNQLLRAENWHLLYCKAKHNEEEGESIQAPLIPALLLEMQWTPMTNYDHFETFRAQIRKISLQMEELFLWKLMQFIQGSISYDSTHAIEKRPPDLSIQRPDPLKARRCYFGNLQLECELMYLSVLTVPINALPVDLQALKIAWNVPLVRFENAPVTLPMFQQHYYFETFDFLLDAIQKHFAQGLKNQAMKILGTVDFLGNPIGFLEDFSGGVQELLFEGNVGGLVTGLSHGVSNSVAKISSSLSDGVGKLTQDRQHELQRQKARAIYSPTTQGGSQALGHLYGGVKGLGVGILGGATSLIGGAIEGAKAGGAEALLVGVGRGFVGTFTKPVQGILDFTTGTATAAKEAVGGGGTKKSRFPGTRIRPPRCTRSLEGTLPPYSHDLATAQQILLTINDNNTNEICLSVDLCFQLNDANLLILICTEQCYVVRSQPDDQRVMLSVAYKDLQGVTAVLKDRHYNLEIRQRSMSDAPRGTQIRCTNKEIAEQLCRKVLFAKQQHDDVKRSLVVPEEILLDSF